MIKGLNTLYKQQQKFSSKGTEGNNVFWYYTQVKFCCVLNDENKGPGTRKGCTKGLFLWQNESMLKWATFGKMIFEITIILL